MLQKHFSELFCITRWTLVVQICKSCPFNVQILLSLSALEHFKNVIVKFRTKTVIICSYYVFLPCHLHLEVPAFSPRDKAETQCSVHSLCVMF